MHRLLLAAILLGPSMAQPGAQPTAVFAGTVRDAVTGQPLAQAQVRLLPLGEGKQYQATTDSAGAFRFNALPPGPYRFQTVRTGFEESHVVVPNEGGKPTAAMQLAPGDNIRGAHISLQPHGVISGRILDSAGDPVGDALVLAMADHWDWGHRSFQPVANAVAGADGRYRLATPAGRYYVVATGARPNAEEPAIFAADPGAQEMRLGQAVYPGANRIEAGAPLEVGPGQQVSGVDLKLPLVPCYHVRGTIQATGQPGTILLTPPDGGWWATSFSRDMRGGGPFDIPGVLPEQYLLYLYPGAVVIAHVEVKDRDVNGVQADPLKNVEVSGRVRAAETDRQALPAIEFQLIDPDRYSRGATNIKPDGTFAISDLPPGRYAVGLSAIPDSGPYVSSVLLDGGELPGAVVDLSHGPVGPLEVVVDHARGQIAGNLRFDGDSVPDAVALLISADGQTGNTRPRQAPLDPNGRFHFAGVPVGRWYVFAVPRFDEGLWQNMNVVLALASEAATVEVSKNGSAQLEVSLISADEIARAAAGVPR